MFINYLAVSTFMLIIQFNRKIVRYGVAQIKLSSGVMYVNDLT